MLVVQVLGQVHFGLGLVNNHLVLVGAGNHVHLLAGFFFLARGPLAQAHGDLMVGALVAVLQRVEL
jgi:hypothetical protein